MPDIFWRGFPEILYGNFLTSFGVQEAGAVKIGFEVINSSPATKS
jgi:hypothetical protein